MPKEWTCPLPNNYPITNEERKIFQREGDLHHGNAYRCGNTMRIVSTISGGGSTYININSGKVISSCSKPCEPPKEWYCD